MVVSVKEHEAGAKERGWEASRLVTSLMCPLINHLKSMAQRHYAITQPSSTTTMHLHYCLAALLLFPGRCFAPPLPPPPLPFILPTLKLRMSALLSASPLFENRFLPPYPNLASFFWRFAAGGPPPPPRSWPERDLLGADSTPTSNKSSSAPSRVASEVEELSFRSIVVWLTFVQDNE